VMVAVMGPPWMSVKMIAVRIRIKWVIEMNSKRAATRSGI
jgi:hypothetical protein